MDEDNRFRRALKSPTVMVGLCILAGIAMYHNIIESTMNAGLPGSVFSTPSPASPAQASSTSSSQVHDEVATQWIDNPIRDPFAPMSVAKQSKPSLTQSAISLSPTHKPHSQASNQLMLKAVAIEAQQRSAVINRQVVYEGEMIAGYQVVSIQLQGVWLKRHGKKQFLTFATNTTS